MPRSGASEPTGIIAAGPMLASLTHDPPTGPGWAWELKWDGIRALSLTRDGLTRLWTRNRNEVTARYPELVPFAAALGDHEAVLDGELVTFDEQSRPSFERFQQRMHVTDRNEIARLAVEVPVDYLLFDVLWVDGRAVTDLPYAERRALLRELVPDGPSWRVPPHAVGSGDEMIAVSRQFSLEGVVAKRVDSRYEPGRRSTTWLKYKLHQQQELVVGGWLPGKGARSTRFGALLLGYHDADGALRYAGRVGTGFNERALDSIHAALLDLERPTSPFVDPLENRAAQREARWVEPELVAQVRFTEWTASGRIRHPAFLGLRDDKPASEVTREG